MALTGTPNEPGAGRGAAPLIGRQEPLDVVAGLIRAGRPVAVVGEVGIGKTALVRAAAAAAGATVREGGGFATLSWLPYLALRRAIGLVETGDAPRVAARVAAEVRSDLLFIDDLQWADDETREVVRLLLGRVSIVVAIRTGDERTAAALGAMTARRVRVVGLEGLSDESAMALARRLRPDLPTSGLERLVRRCGGNPLVVEELAIHGRVSSPTARALAGQLALLSARDRRGLALAALAEQPIDARALGAVASRLVGAGFLRVRAGSIEVRHRLLVDAVAEGLEPAARRELHAQLGAITSSPAERAHHLAAAGRRSDALAAARVALASEADPNARARLLRVAVESSDDSSGYRLEAAFVQRALGNNDAAIALLAAPLPGRTDAHATAAAVRAAALAREGRHAEARSELDAARALCPGSSGDAAAELAATEAALLAARGQLREAIRVLEGAIETCASAQARERLAGQRIALRLHAGGGESLQRLEGAVARAVAERDGDTAALRAVDLAGLSLARGGGPAAEGVATSAADRIGALGYRERAMELRARAARARIFAGDPAGALERTGALLGEPATRRARQHLATSRGLALAMLGRVEEATLTLAEAEAPATRDFDGRGSLLWAQSEAAFWGGQPLRAIALAGASVELAARHEPELALPALTRAWAEVELGRPPTPLPAMAGHRFSAGAEPELRGLRAMARGDHAEAAACFATAASSWAGYHIPRELVCRWAAGDALGQAGSRSQSIAVLRAVAADAAAIGFEPLAARARRSLRIVGERPAGSVGAGRGDGLLTGREREVVGHVERGLTNAEIARRMSLGRPTVARLLSNAMLKLGADSRAHAVVLAARMTAGLAGSGAIGR